MAQVSATRHTSGMKKTKKHTPPAVSPAIENITTAWPSLTGLRGLAALWVLLLHAFSLSGKPEMLPTAFAWLFQMGWAGVDIFFTLSAFLLSIPYVLALRKKEPAPDTQVYFKRRFARILPAYYLQLGLLLLLVSTGIAKSVFWYAPTLEATLAHIVFWFNSFPLVPAYVSPWWTLPVELGFYLMLPWLAKCLTDKRWWYLLLGVAASLLYRHAVLHSGFQRSEEIYWVEHLPGRLFQFLIGMLAAFFFVKWREKYQAMPSVIRNAVLLAASSGLIMLPALGWFVGDAYNGAPTTHPLLAYWHLFASLLIASILLMLVSGKTWLDGLLNAWPMQWLGTISYGLYLWHYPVMLLLREQMGGMQYVKTDFISFFIIGFLVSITLAFLSWHWLEAPMLKRVSETKSLRSD